MASPRAKPKPPPWRREVTSANVRDAVLFVSGLGLTMHEVLLREHVRTPALLLFAAMMHLPGALRLDELLRSRGGE